MWGLALAFVVLVTLAGLHVEPLMLTAVLAGLCVGSFLNVVVYRLPIILEREWVRDLRDSVPGHLKAAAVSLGCHATSADTQPDNVDASFSLAVPRSRCPKCGHPISAVENIPVVSFIALRGRCHGCRTPISMRYPLVELFTGALTFLVLAILGLTIKGLFVVLVCWVSIALSLIDLDKLTIPNSLTGALLWGALVASTQNVLVEPTTAILGACGGYSVLYVLNFLIKKLTGADSIGQGDFKLLAAIGALVGATSLPLVLLSGAVGVLVASGLIATLQRRSLLSLRLPFGPFLMASTVALLLASEHRLEFADLVAKLLLGLTF